MEDKFTKGELVVVRFSTREPIRYARVVRRRRRRERLQRRLREASVGPDGRIVTVHVVPPQLFLVRQLASGKFLTVPDTYLTRTCAQTLVAESQRRCVPSTPQTGGSIEDRRGAE